jgi:hypothetical protein
MLHYLYLLFVQTRARVCLCPVVMAVKDVGKLSAGIIN